MRLYRNRNRDCNSEIGKTGHAGLSFKRVLLLAVIFSLLPFTQAQALAADADSGRTDEAVFAALCSNERQPDPAETRLPDQPTVYLTFDDGPSANTPDVLDILHKADVKATFFVLGEYVEARPDLVKRIVREGHAIGNHTYDHVYSELYGSFGEFWRQIQLTETALQNAADVRTLLVRAPGGTYTNFDASYFYYLEQAGYRIFDWNVDSGDSKRKGVPAREIVEGATNLSNAKKTPNEVVVLMHDGTGHSETVKALPDIIRFYRESGYAFASLTPDAKPVQMPLGKLKWKRDMAYADYANWAAAAREHAALWAAETVPPAAETVVSAIGGATASSGPALPEAAEPPPAPPLLLHMAAGTWALEGADNSFRDGALYVPLRMQAEAMGGEVEWREQSREAVVRYGVKRIVYDLPHRTITASSPGEPDKRLMLADISLVDSRLIVPLRAAVELLGGNIEDYTLEANRREVMIAGLAPFDWDAVPHSPSLSAARLAVAADLPNSPKK